VSLPSAGGLGTVAPAVFVLLWASGFVVARWAAPHSPPLTFLAMRFALTLLVLGPLILLARAPWPARPVIGHLAVAGLLLQGCYLSGVWVAVSMGMSAGVSALIVNLQPVLTAVLLVGAGQSVRPRHWLGLLLGLAGVAMVVLHKTGTEALSPAAVVLCTGGLLAITVGTLYQRRYAPSFDLRTGAFVQFAASLVAVAPLALLLEREAPRFGPELALALAWAVFALSIAAVSLMNALLRRGSATRVASLFYLVPPVTAAQAWLLFGEPFGLLAALGMVVTAVGVALVVRP